MILKEKQKKVIAWVVISLFVVTSFSFFFQYTPLGKADDPFSTNVKVNTDSTAIQSKATIAADSSGNAYVAWQDRRDGNYDIYFAKTLDQGSTWSDPIIKINPDGDSTNQSNPAIKVGSSGTTYVAWQDKRNGDWDIYFANSTDGGSTWTDPNIKVNSDSTTEDQYNPDLAVGPSGTIYAVWEDHRNGDWDIYFAMSTNGGYTWSGNERVNTDYFIVDQRSPTIAVDSSGAIYVAWEDGSGVDIDIHFAKSTNGGVDWTDPSEKVNSDSSGLPQGSPSIAVNSTGTIYLTWYDWRSSTDSDIYFAQSEDGGTTWPNRKVNSDTGTKDQYYPSLDVSPTGTIYIAWEDFRSDTIYGSDIYFTFSIDGGMTWEDPNIRVNDETSIYSQDNPCIAVGPTGPVYVAWEDGRNGDDDIYSANIDQVNPFPTVDELSVEGFLGSTPEIQHIIDHNPAFSFEFNDPSSDSLSRFDVSVWNEAGSTLLWDDNRSYTASSGSTISVTYNTPPSPTDGPELLDGTTYKLRVKVQNNTGIWSHISEVDFHMNEVLVPTNPNPADDSLISPSATQTVTWASPGVDAEGESPQSYNWEVATDSGFTVIVESGSGLVTESGQFDTSPTGDFYWRVNLSDGWETGQYVNIPDGYWNFTASSGVEPNNPPVITNKESEPDTAFVNITLVFTFLATDEDSDTLTWSKVSGPGWLSIGTTNGTIYGKPSSSDIGSNEYEIEVSDGKGGDDNHTFTIDVQTPSATNNDPVITNKASAPTKATVGTKVAFTFEATDEDMDTLSWSKTSGPEWLKIGVSNGTIYGTPSSSDLDANSFTIQVTDGKGGADDHTFIVDVETDSDGDGDGGDDEEDSGSLLWLIIIIIIIILIILFLIFYMRKKKRE